MRISFYKLFGLLIGTISLLAVFLALATFSQGPRIRNSSVDMSGQHPAMILNLASPLDQKQSLKQFITVSPQTTFSATAIAEQINITFQGNLQANTTYNVTVKAGLKDIRGTKEKHDFKTSFTTSEATYTYLQRTYTCAHPPCRDQIIEQQVDVTKQKVLAQATHIKTFDRNRDYLVILQGKGENTDSLYAINLHTGQRIDIPIFRFEKVQKVKISPFESVVGFIAYDNRGTGQDHLESFVLNEKRSLEITPPGQSNGIGNFFFSHDGQSLLYQDFNQAYYITNPMSANYKPTLIGTYADSSGFNYDDNKLLFQDSNGLYQIYDARSKTTQLAHLSFSAQVALFSSSSNNLIAQQFVFNTDSYYNTLVFYSTGKTTYQFDTGTSLTNFSSSPDDRYVLMETSHGSSGFDNDRSYSGFEKSTDAQVLLYDTLTKKVLSKALGSDPVWLY